MNLRSMTLFAATIVLAASASAQEYQAGAVHISHLHARVSMPGQTSGGAYLTLENSSGSTDSLIAVQSPAARSVEMHTMAMSDNVMRMREVEEIRIAPKEKIVMQAGDGYHLMLIGLKAPLKAGDKIPLTLTFRKAGKVQTMMTVEDDAAMPSMDHAHH